MSYRTAYSVERVAADCFAIIRADSDGARFTIGTYSNERDARAELRLVREAN